MSVFLLLCLFVNRNEEDHCFFLFCIADRTTHRRQQTKAAVPLRFALHTLLWGFVCMCALGQVDSKKITIDPFFIIGRPQQTLLDRAGNIDINASPAIARRRNQFLCCIWPHTPLKRFVCAKQGIILSPGLMAAAPAAAALKNELLSPSSYIGYGGSSFCCRVTTSYG